MSIKINKIKQPDATIEAGTEIMKGFNRHKLGEEKYIVIEEIFYAAIDAQMKDIAKKCLLKLQTKFPTSETVKRLKAMYFEMIGSE